MNTRPMGGRRVRQDAGETLIELLLAVTLLGTAVAACAQGLFASVVASRESRSDTTDHLHATQEAERLVFARCADLPGAYSSAVSGVTVDAVDVWDGQAYVPADPQSPVCEASPLHRLRIHYGGAPGHDIVVVKHRDGAW